MDRESDCEHAFASLLEQLPDDDPCFPSRLQRIWTAEDEFDALRDVPVDLGSCGECAKDKRDLVGAILLLRDLLEACGNRLRLRCRDVLTQSQVRERWR